MADGSSRAGGSAKWLGRLGASAQNALEIMRGGRFSAPYRAGYTVAWEDRAARLRHYAAEGDGPPSTSVLLVPPLMVTAEIYDISPELSAVTWLRRRGVDVWVVDFGRPEDDEGGLTKTLDDHVLSVDRAVSHLLATSGRPVHLGGYSQGGMFVYQCAAYRRCEGIASLITFGSPVDIHRNLPAVRDDVASKLIRGAREAVAKPLETLEGLPGALTSAGFRVLSARKEFQQVVELFSVLHDREALEKRETRRRFLLGEGFVAWPGPALRTFIDEFVVNNRMADGGFVIGGRTITLADIDVPVLCFIGATDEIARPASVRAIHDAAPRAAIQECHVPAGHFGLVVGGRSLAITWPTVREWLLWHDGLGDTPQALRPVTAEADAEEASFDDVELGMEFVYDFATDLVEDLWGRVGDISQQVGEAVDVMRWQLPRVAQIRKLSDATEVSVGKALAEQAAAIPEATFFLWGGRAFTYREADERVTNVAAGLWTMGVRPGDRVGVWMSNRPTYLSLVCALSRIGAVAVLFNVEARGEHLRAAIDASKPHWMVADPDHAELLRGVWRKKVHVLGGGPSRALPKRFVDMEAIDVEGFAFPPEVRLNAGTGGDLAMLMFTSGTTGLPKAARVTNRRWALAALGTAAACRLTSNDTVYCCLPLHHATAMLVAIGGGLVGGCRIALAPRFSTTTFWNEVRRYGATVVFYVGEICRHLVNAPEVPGERKNPVRVFAGTGMREDVWTQLLARFEPDRVVEFYGSTEGNAVLVNLTGRKVGSVGRPAPGGPQVALLRFDAHTGALERRDGRVVAAEPGEPGVLVARVVTGDPVAEFDGYTDAEATRERLLRDAFEPGDAWFVTGDVLRRDDDGDYFFVDRLGDSFRWRGENVSTELVARVVRSVPSTAFTVAYGVALPRRDGRAGMVAVQLRDGHTFDGGAYFRAVNENLSPSARPVFLRVVDDMAFTASHKLKKSDLAAAGADPLRVERVYRYDEERSTYMPLDAAAYAALGG